MCWALCRGEAALGKYVYEPYIPERILLNDRELVNFIQNENRSNIFQGKKQKDLPWLRSGRGGRNNAARRPRRSHLPGGRVVDRLHDGAEQPLVLHLTHTRLW